MVNETFAPAPCPVLYLSALGLLHQLYALSLCVCVCSRNRRSPTAASSKMVFMLFEQVFQQTRKQKRLPAITENPLVSFFP